MTTCVISNSSAGPNSEFDVVDQMITPKRLGTPAVSSLENRQSIPHADISRWRTMGTPLKDSPVIRLSSDEVKFLEQSAPRRQGGHFAYDAPRRSGFEPDRVIPREERSSVSTRITPFRELVHSARSSRDSATTTGRSLVDAHPGESREARWRRRVQYYPAEDRRQMLADAREVTDDEGEDKREQREYAQRQLDGDFSDCTLRMNNNACSEYARHLSHKNCEIVSYPGGTLRCEHDRTGHPLCTCCVNENHETHSENACQYIMGDESQINHIMCDAINTVHVHNEVSGYSPLTNHGCETIVGMTTCAPLCSIEYRKFVEPTRTQECGFSVGMFTESNTCVDRKCISSTVMNVKATSHHGTNTRASSSTYRESFDDKKSDIDGRPSNPIIQKSNKTVTDPTLATAAATLTTALGPALAAAAAAASNLAIPPPGLAIPQLGATALQLRPPSVVSPARLSSSCSSSNYLMFLFSE